MHLPSKMQYQFSENSFLKIAFFNFVSIVQIALWAKPNFIQFSTLHFGDFWHKIYVYPYNEFCSEYICKFRNRSLQTVAFIFKWKDA